MTGIPRSGTSLMMQMLAAGGLDPLTDGVRAPDPDNPRGYFELEAAKRLPRDASWLAGAVGRAVKIVQPLVTSLPEGFAYRILWMRRPLDEVLESQRHMLARRGADADDLPPERLRARFGALHRALEGWIAERDGARLLAVEYPGAVADPAACARAVDGFLGGGLDCAAMSRAVDPGLYRRKADPPA